MMKSMRLLSVVTLSLNLVACSEGTYQPVQTNPAAQNQMGYNNGMYNNGVNPFLSQNGMTAYNQMGPQGQLAFQNQFNQSMYSCAMRATPNLVYFQKTQMNNCVVRRAPTYTPNNCACVTAPCNCAKVLRQTRKQYRVAARAERRGQTVVYTEAPATETYEETISYQPTHESVLTETTNSSTTTSEPSTTDALNEESRVLPLTIKGIDAKALYVRLAKATEETDNQTKTKIRTGSNYKCMMDNKGKKPEDYACDIDVSITDGVVYQLYPTGQPGVAVLSSPEVYNGHNVRIGGQGLNPDEGYIKIQGSGARLLYSKLNAPVTPGMLEITQPPVQASIKVGKQVKCYETIGTSPIATECLIKVNAAIGEAEAATLN